MCMYVYVYIYIYIYTHMHIYLSLFRQGLGCSDMSLSLVAAKTFQGLGPKRRESSNGDRVYEQWSKVGSACGMAVYVQTCRRRPDGLQSLTGT